MNGLDWQTIQIPIAAGLAQKQNDQAMNPPNLTRALDVQFDDVGSVEPRPSYFGLGTVAAAANGNIFGGGTISTGRRLVTNGDELLLFDKDTLYSWNAQNAVWVSRGTHLAAEIAEGSRFVTTDDQIAADRAELGGVVFFSWHKVVAGNTTGYVAAVDKITGSVLMSPYELVGYQRIRLTALTTTVMLTFYDGIGGIYAFAMDPTSPTTALGGSSTTVSSTGVGTSAGPYYDIVKVPSADTAAFVVGAAAAVAYTVGTITASLTVGRTSKARNTTSALAISCAPGGASAQIVRGDAGNVVGDLITLSTRADVYTAQAVGTYSGALNQIAAAHRSVTDASVYRCYAFWSSNESASSTTWQSRTNWVSTGNTLGTEATFVRMLGIGSRAFDHDGRVFVWTVFAGESTFSGVSPPAFRAQLQNTYFLYRDDAFLTAKAARFNAGGFSALTGHLPGVQSLGSGVYAMSGGERRVIQLGEKQSGYGARAPREVKVTFDSDAARRCVRHGQTLYVTGGELLQYDGVGLTEASFHLYPHYFGGIEVGPGNLADGTYTYKVTWRWDNAQSEIDRSTTATTGEVTIAGGPNGVSIIGWTPLFVTHKTSTEVAVEAWRTAVNPTDDAPFYLVTSKDPAALTNPNRYTPNLRTGSSLATLNDELADEDLTILESSPDNYGVLENLAPPACTIIAANADRLFIAGVAGDPHRIWYSKLREDGQVAAFNDALTATVPPGSGPITALAFLNDTLIAFKETAIYALSGDGYNNLGQGINYGPARVLSVDVGAIDHDSVALCDKGLIFKSRKGWYVLNRGWTVDYIGGGVSDYDAETVNAVHVVEGQHQIRCVTQVGVAVPHVTPGDPPSAVTGRVLLYDPLVNQWAEWSIEGVHAAVWNGTHCYLTEIGALSDAGVFDQTDATSYDVETGWIKPADLQGYVRIRAINILGIYGTPQRIRVRLARDYQLTYFDDRNWTVNGSTTGDPVQVRVQPPIQQVQAIKVRITMVFPTVPGNAYAFAPMTLTGIGLEVGIKRGLYRRMPAAQRQ